LPGDGSFRVVPCRVPGPRSLPLHLETRAAVALLPLLGPLPLHDPHFCCQGPSMRKLELFVTLLRSQEVRDAASPLSNVSGLGPLVL
jgi:hypothetical protein